MIPIKNKLPVPYRSVSVKKRILGGVVTIMVMLSLSVLLLLALQNNYISHLDHVIEVELQTERYLLKAYARINLARLNLFRYLHDYVPSTWNALEEAKQAEKLINEAVFLLGEEGRAHLPLQGLSPLFANFEEHIIKAQLAAERGDKSEVTRIMFQASKICTELGWRIERIVKVSEGHVQTTNQDARARAQRKLYYYLAGYAAVFLVTIVMSLYLAKSITVPVKELRKGAESFQQGQFDYTLRVVGNDELTLLAKTFNKMAERLRGTFESQEQHRENLEIAVRERTAEILSTNVQLTHEIEERKKIEIALHAAKEEAELGSRMKGEFLANMSHEIRTPMNGVIGMASLLLQTAMTEEQRGYTNTIRSSGDGLLTIINDILDFSKIEVGKLEFEFLDFDLRVTLDEVIEMMAESAHCKGLAIGCVFSPGVEYHLIGDPGRLRQVITNLLTNAIKFTRAGEVLVRVNQVGTKDESVVLEFAVEDTGIGIPIEKQDRLFKTFSQVDASNTREFGGTGLGLIISKRLAVMMGGDISFVSKVGEGSTFSFIAEFYLQQRPHDKLSELPVDIRGKRILAVDDNRVNREILKGFLLGWKCRYKLARNGMEALGCMETAVEQGDPFKLVLVDHIMPGMDGYEFAKAVRNNQGLKDTPLILLTSHGLVGGINEYGETTFAATLTKPIRQVRLHEVIMSVYGKISSFVQRGVDHKRPEALRQFPVKALVVEDNVTNQKVVKYILEVFGCDVDAVANGSEAVEAFKSIGYDIIFMDIQMPVMDGIMATAKIRELEDKRVKEGGEKVFPPVPIIACTANAMKGDREKYLQAGLDDYVDKPIDTEKMYGMLMKWSGKNITMESFSPSIIENGEEGQVEVMKSESVEMVFDLKGALARTLNDKDFLKTLIGSFVEEQIAGLVEFADFVGREDYQSIQRKGHTIKGAAANVGAIAVSRTGLLLEECGRNCDLSSVEGYVEKLHVQLIQLQTEMDRVV